MNKQAHLKGKVAIVTGSSRGIGKTIAIALAEQGSDVVVNYFQNKEKAEEVVKQITEIGQQSFPFKADVKSEEQVNEMVEQALKRFNKLDILINNAGISKDSISWKMKPELWDEILRTNLYGVFYCTKAALRHMVERRNGRIISISSVVGQIGAPGTCAYAASKAGIIGFTKSVAKEVAKRGITVNVLGLGYFQDGGLLSTIPENIQNNILSQIPVGRFGRSRIIGEVVTFLCSDVADYITGQVININGGLI